MFVLGLAFEEWRVKCTESRRPHLLFLDFSRIKYSYGNTVQMIEIRKQMPSLFTLFALMPFDGLFLGTNLIGFFYNITYPYQFHSFGYVLSLIYCGFL